MGGLASVFDLTCWPYSGLKCSYLFNVVVEKSVDECWKDVVRERLTGVSCVGVACGGGVRRMTYVSVARASGNV